MSHYIGSAQVKPESLALNSGASAPLDSLPLVVLDDELNSTELSLLNKIMKAAGKPDFKTQYLTDFNKEQVGHKYCLVLADDYDIEQNNFEVFNAGKTIMLQSCSLAKFLPPTNNLEIQKNKQLLWKSIQLLFKI